MAAIVAARADQAVQPRRRRHGGIIVGVHVGALVAFGDGHDFEDGARGHGGAGAVARGRRAAVGAAAAGQVDA